MNLLLLLVSLAQAGTVGNSCTVPTVFNAQGVCDGAAITGVTAEAAIADGAVTTAKLEAAAVDTAKLKSGSVTLPMLNAGGAAKTCSAGQYLDAQVTNSGGIVTGGTCTAVPGGSAVVANSISLSTPTALTSLAGDNVLITVDSGTGYLRFTSNDTTSTNRTFCLSAGAPGQILILESVNPGTNEIELLDGSISGAGSCTVAAGAKVAQLAGVWPAATNQPNDMLILIYNGAWWMEIARGAL